MLNSSSEQLNATIPYNLSLDQPITLKRIKIMSSELTLYTKGHCPFCRRAKLLLAEKGVSDWSEHDLEVVPDKRDEMISRSNGMRTVPQIFIDGHHIGGSDDLIALDQSGELDLLLNSRNVA
jgi:glutaredoxin 3